MAYKSERDSKSRKNTTSRRAVTGASEGVTSPVNVPARTLRVKIFTIIFLVLLTGTSASFYRMVYIPYRNQVEHSATATALVLSTIHAQGTRQAQITATGQALEHSAATATARFQNEYRRITGTTPILNDLLGTPDLVNWETNPFCTFANGAYHVIAAQEHAFVSCTARHTYFSDFAYQVHLHIVRGDKGGIVFRANPASGRYYLFEVASDGHYALYYYPDNTGRTAKKLAFASSTPLAIGPQQENTISVIARGTSLTLYINGLYVTRVSNPSLHAGLIGVLADDDRRATEVVYTRAQVWQLS